MPGVLDEIAKDSITSIPSENQPLFATEIDYDALVKKREVIVAEWREMPEQERKKYGSQEKFESERDAPDLKSSNLVPERNYALLVNEIRQRIAEPGLLKQLSIDALNFDEFILELAESIENVVEIRDLYTLRKRTTGKTKNAGISNEEASRLKNCFSQGRELFIAGKQGSLMVKPLNFFYALTAYAYGVIVLNNPVRFRKGNLPGSHGMAYLPDEIQAQFGGDSAKGTFSDLVTAFPTQLVKTAHVEIAIDCSDSIVKLYSTKFNVSIGTLLSMIPEMTDYYKLTTGRNSRCHPVSIVNANNPRDVVWEFQIGDGETRPDPIDVERSFPGLEISERFGKSIIMVPASQASTIKACIYTDIRGDAWYIENPFFPVILPEIATHFLINSMFSNIMRYRPDEWGDVLSNQVSSKVSLLARHYFSSFQRKFFVVVLRSVSRYLPFAAG